MLQSLRVWEAAIDLTTLTESTEDDPGTAAETRLWAASGQQGARRCQGQLYQSRGHSLNTARLPFAIKSLRTPTGNIMCAAFLLLITLRVKTRERSRKGGQKQTKTITQLR